MTGGTLILRKGDLYTITKVAHDGFLNRKCHKDSLEKLVNDGASGRDLH